MYAVIVAVFFVACWQHFTLQEFGEKIEAAAMKMKAKILESPEKIVVFYAPQNVNKSNLWVCTLASFFVLPTLRQKLTNGMFFVISEVQEFYHLDLDRNEFLVVEFDDMSYSGQQLAKSLFPKKFKENTPLRQRVAQNTYIVVPFITEKAIEHIKHEVGEIGDENFLTEVQIEGFD